MNMISNITNALPMMLKRMKEKDDSIKLNILELQNNSRNNFKLKEQYRELIKSFQITLDTLPFLKDFEYVLNIDKGMITIRSSMEDFSIFSLIMLGSIKNLPIEVKNKGIFISLAMNYLKFCIASGYNACTTDDVKVLEDYNEDFDKNTFDYISFIPTSESSIGTIHFIGIEFNKEILCIFEKYKDVKFTYNHETGSFIISMKSEFWNDFWKNAPQYLKNEFGEDGEQKINVM